VATASATGAIEPDTSLRAVAIAFFSLGLFFGTWAVGAADIERALGVATAASVRCWRSRWPGRSPRAP
jgi:hypothetical protein